MRALPIENVLIIFEVGEFKLGTFGEIPLQRRLFGDAAGERVKFHAGIPKASFIADLRGGAPEADCAPFWIVNVPEVFEK